MMLAKDLRETVFKHVLQGELTGHHNELKAIDDGLFSNFLIPEDWNLVTVKESCYVHSRIGWQALTKNEHQKSGDYMLITGTDFKEGLINYSTCVFVSKERYDMDDKIKIKNDDILITKDGTLGKVAVVKNLPMPATLNGGVFVVRPDDRFDKEYIELIFNSSYFTRFINDIKKSTTIKHLNQAKLHSFLIPLPSIDEQKQIVEITKYLMTKIDEYEKLEKQLDKLNKDFPGDMKDAISEKIFKGELTFRLKSDSNVDDLFNQITKVKQNLINNGRLKKEKELDSIKDVPFEIPNEWKWVRIGNYCEKVTDQVASGSFASLRENVKSLKVPDYALMVKTADFANEFKKDLTYTDEHGYNFLSNSNLFGGELIFSNIGSIGKVFIVPELNRPMTLAPNSIMLRLTDNKLRDYIYHYFLSPTGYKQLMSITSGTAMKKFNKTDFKNLLIPIPPIEEQQRIVDLLDKVLPLCDDLNKLVA